MVEPPDGEIPGASLEDRIRRLEALLATEELRDAALRRIRKLNRHLERLDERLETLERWTSKSSKVARALLAEDEEAERTRELENVYVAVCRTARPVREPLALISQAPRSGGTLLSQLCDGHPQIHAHPYELQIGYPGKSEWPPLDLGEPPELWWSTLLEVRAALHARVGYSKGSPEQFPLPEQFPFVFLVGLQRQLFLLALASRPPRCRRDILDAYMTSYFNAWLDNHNRQGEKRVVTAFAPYVVGREGSLDAFFADYPDGRLISIVREPRAWLVSARAHYGPEWSPRVDETPLEGAVAVWRENVEGALRARDRFGERVLLLRFEDLVTATGPVMERVARHLGVDMAPELLRPTFNGMPIGPNSGLGGERERPASGTLWEAPLARAAQLDDGEAGRVQELTAATLHRALAATASF